MKEITHKPWLYDVTPFKITDNIWYVGNKQVSVHLIDTGDGLILIDTAWPSTLYMLIDSIYSAGFNPYDVKYIVHSHYHVDHFGGTRRFVEKYGSKTIMGKGDEFMFNGRQDLNYCETFKISEEFGDFKIDRFVSEGDVIRLGNTEIEVVEAPGHTPGTLALFINSTIEGKPVRCAMHGGIGLNTCESSYMKEHNINWRGDYAATMDKLGNEQVDVVLGNHPGQARVFERLENAKPGENPFYDPTAWRSFISENKRKFYEKLENDPI